MAQDAIPLSDEERRELEELRAQKRAREEATKARRERAELERLRAEQAHTATPDDADLAQAERRARAARERGRKLMEPGDDLSMPLGQKLVLMAVFLAAVGFVVAILFTRG
ncbi:MAG: hypothetical protein J6S63_11365 [Atopobiaceae bacterium]|nr:hypothetical protein [Atopobiaceae bacterium]